MECETFIRNIPQSTSHAKLKLELSNILHMPPFRDDFTNPPFNFENRGKPRTGALTFPSPDLARSFLSMYGGRVPQRSVVIRTNRLQFEPSIHSARPEVLRRIQSSPFQDPRETYEREKRNSELDALSVNVSTIQFGWECRDSVYSVEWEKECTARLTFDGARREFCVKMDQSNNRAGANGDSAEPSSILDDNIHSLLTINFDSILERMQSVSRLIVIHASQVYWVSASVEDQPSKHPVVHFSLMHPPSFQSEDNGLLNIFNDRDPPRQRWSSFTDDHAPTAPYISLSMRLVCASFDDLRNFKKFARDAHVHVHDFDYPIERRQLFSPARCQEYSDWLNTLPWTVAFQIEALVRSWLLSFAEVLSLRTQIEDILRLGGRGYTVAFLREFYSHAKTLYWYGALEVNDLEGQLPPGRPALTYSDPVVELFSQVRARFIYEAPPARDPSNSPFQCLRVVITPTTMILEGPFPERSNRVMRTYHANQESFLRVLFQDENRLQFRFDREIDGRGFINRRVKPILLDGFTVAGRKFDFLAYSQSALKEHAVWFVKPFQYVDEHGTSHTVDAASIIQSLGNFKQLSFDPNLIYCPARYAARISQAFTATDASVSIDVGQDARTISPQLAKEDRTYPRSKGMLSVDYTLPERSILIRHSMIKFEAPHSSTIDIARAFSTPSPFFLNRPLIMLLEGLGVPYEVFQSLQDDAVKAANRSLESLEASARLLEGHGLGASFRMTSLGLGPLQHDEFWRQMMDFAINHVLRELKHHARIPVPGKHSWTLVGVADVYGYLEEGEVFVCVDSPKETELIYLEGRVLVSRSPVIHPGDAQVVYAIGRPPPDSPFARESLRNTIVFSTRGVRPLPSCLGGGDLDGDEYNVTTRPELLPTHRYEPADYEPAKRKLIAHESTMRDVAEFVAEYINSDTLGVIATRWLILADQSTEGIFDPGCLKLAELHSKAVDYAKSGLPVPIEEIPELKDRRMKPDWNAPETITRENDEEYYPSTRAIGKLFRSIVLHAPGEVRRVARRQRRNMEGANLDEQLAGVLDHFYGEPDEPDEVLDAVRERVGEFVDPEEYEFDDNAIAGIWEHYGIYVAALRAICADYTLSHSRSNMLTEEEAVIGTIVAKCSQPRKRKDLMSQMREQTATLVSDARDEISGGDDMLLEDSLRRAWIAYRLAHKEGDSFGARSFAYVALGCIFEAIKEIEKQLEDTHYV
ncbi:RdRP-domain-containing protein [Daedaleopsis nitida]|nr:RdRP-domain-containing protein [Daedaleopsis nitida]